MSREVVNNRKGEDWGAQKPCDYSYHWVSDRATQKLLKLLLRDQYNMITLSPSLLIFTFFSLFYCSFIFSSFLFCNSLYQSEQANPVSYTTYSKLIVMHINVMLIISTCISNLFAHLIDLIIWWQSIQVSMKNQPRSFT